MLFAGNVAANSNRFQVFADFVYWRATETVDWVLTNSLNASNQDISYKTAKFNFEPGLRIGVAYTDNFVCKLYYTGYYTSDTQTASGNLVSTFFGGKAAQGSNTFFTVGQLNFSINYNTVDFNLGKSIEIFRALLFRPYVGLKTGWIHQKVDTSFQNMSLSINEYTKNNFYGLGPKIGIEIDSVLQKTKKSLLVLTFDFDTAYMWGQWKFMDRTVNSNNTEIFVDNHTRHLGALSLHALVGLKLNYKCVGLKVGYEIQDWFDQYQTFDDGTGAQDKDLILQGLTLRLVYSL